MFCDYPDFFPTPVKLSEKMLSGINFKYIQSVLEPSAGKGDLIEAAAKKMNGFHSRKDALLDGLDIDAVEINPDLRYILKGKGIRVIHDDFLTLQTSKRYDLILMNPPFSNGCHHLLKALQMQENGGYVVCLLNAETIKNPNTNARKELLQKLTKYKAKIDFVSDAFRDAERKTLVEVALIEVKIPQVKRHSILIEQLRQEENIQPDDSSEFDAMIHSDYIKRAIEQYNFEVRSGLKLIEEYQAMQPYILKGFKEPCSPILTLKVNDAGGSSRIENSYIIALRQKYWEALFQNKEFMGLLTSNLQNEYLNKVSELANYDFSLFNIYSIRCDMNNHIEKGIEETILALFDEFSHKHYWNEQSNNIHYYNGWKTNEAYKVNKKVIIPLNGFGYFGDRIDYGYKVKQKLEDIEKVFNYLDGGITLELDLDRALKRAEVHGETKRIPLKYFYVTFYKKGTCHIEFNNEQLLKKFNIFGSQRKGWLPPSYGQTAYSDMSAEERAAVDGFEGAGSYAETMEKRNYYFSATLNFPLLEADSIAALRS